MFDLKPMSNRYLVFRPDELVFSLSSDQISNSLRTTERMKHITSQVSEAELDEFQYLGATLGGTILFPGKQINRKITINVARGWSKQIEDRIDLTLECIRLQYEGHPNPLGATLAIYWKFFELFETFDQYVNFFLLQDLVPDGRVKFFLPFDDFKRPALPVDVDEYREYMANCKAFVRARGRRMNEWGSSPIKREKTRSLSRGKVVGVQETIWSIVSASSTWSIAITLAPMIPTSLPALL
jgi:hypothetical protein